MKIIPTGLRNSLISHASTVATLWKIIRTDGVAMGFTNHSKDIYTDGVLYIARTGYTPTAITSNSTLAVDNLDLEGILSEGGITDEDVRAGIYDYADVTVYQTNYKDPTFPKTILRRGNIGELTLKDGIYVSEIRGMSQKLARQFIRTVLPDCDAELYDDRCTVDPTTFRNDGIVTTIVEDRYRFAVEITGTARDEGYFNGGYITFNTGVGANRGAEIDLDEVNRVFRLQIRFPWLITAGDTFRVQRGCDKTFTTCKEIFDNAVNHRGFHKVPGNDAIFKTPDVKG